MYNLKTHHVGLDALRIVAMLFIVLLHVLDVGGVLYRVNSNTVHYHIIWFLRIISASGVNCFGLLSGYLGIHAQHKYSTLAMLWCQTVFWSLLLYVLSWFTNAYSATPRDLLYGIMPVTFGSWWYFSSYFVLFLIMPILNLVFEYKPTYIPLFLVSSGIVLTVLPRISINFSVATKAAFDLGVIWLSWLYVLGGYLRQKEELISKIPKGILFSLYSFGLLGSYVCLLLGDKFSSFSVLKSMITNNNSPFILLSSISLLLLFSHYNPTLFKQLVIKLASVSFSVYIIHFHPRVRVLYLSNRALWTLDYSWWKMLIFLLIMTLSIYVICSIVDLPRLLLFEHLNLKKRLNSVLD